MYSWYTNALIIESVNSCVYTYTFTFVYTIYVCIQLIQIILLYSHTIPLVTPWPGIFGLWDTSLSGNMCPCILVSTITLTLWQFWRWTFAPKSTVGIDPSAQDGKNHAVVLLYKWATGQWFQCTFHYISFPWANRMVWMLNLQCFGHILELNQALLDVKTPLHYFNPSIRCCLCWYLIWKSLQTALGSSARSGWQRTRWNCLWAWWSIAFFDDWHGLALHCPPLKLYMSLVHIYSKHCTERTFTIPDVIMSLEKVVCFDRERMAMQNISKHGPRTCCYDFGVDSRYKTHGEGTLAIGN